MIGCTAILLGFAPIAHLQWSMQSDTGTPLSFPLVLKHGEYASVPFTTDERWSYWLTLEFNHLPRTFENLCEIGYYEDCKGIEPVAFNWQLIDDKGAALQEKENTRPAGNSYFGGQLDGKNLARGDCGRRSYIQGGSEGLFLRFCTTRQSRCI